MPLLPLVSVLTAQLTPEAMTQMGQWPIVAQENGSEGMEQRLTRRRLLRSLGRLAGAGALGALLFKRVDGGEARARDNCFWTKVAGPTCSGGKLREYWCLRCCGGGVCETIYCEWRVVGSC
jgi:hypothetical protein